jgi:hypothetical protein
MVRLLAEAGFEPDGPVDAVRTPPSPALERVAELVDALGGDARRFRAEASVVQVLASARPARAMGHCAGAIPDPWRGSRPLRVLFAPDLSDPADRWAKVLDEVLTGLGADEATTVGVALPIARIQEPPEALREVAEKARVDLLLTEAPGDAAGWERLLAGAGAWVATSRRDELRALAARVGLEVQDASPGALAA